MAERFLDSVCAAHRRNERNDGAGLGVQSGKMRVVCFRFGCNGFYRTQAQQLALSALRMSAWAKQYYRGKRAEGKRHQHALRCLANLLMKIAFAIWRDQTVYDENRHLA